MSSEIIFTYIDSTNTRQQCHCFRHVIGHTWNNLEKFNELGLILNPGDVITRECVNTLFKISYDLYRLHRHLEPCSLFYLCTDYIANAQLNTESIPPKLQHMCTIENVLPTKLWPWSKEWDIAPYFLSHIGFTVETSM